MKKNFIVFAVLLILVSLTGCKNNINHDKDKKHITVSAAASLKEPLDKIVSNFEKEKNIKVDVNYGGSGTLQKQIEEGAPVDLFISAGKNQMDILENKKLIDSKSRTNLLKNELVVVYSKSLGTINSIEEIVNKDVSIALGEVKTVPAGQYGKQSLEALGLWDKVSKNAIYTNDVKEVIRLIQHGEVKAGIAYCSDTTDIGNEYGIIKIPSNTHEAIVYPAAIIESSKNKDIAKTFIEFLKSSDSSKIFKGYKFEMYE